MIRMIFLLLTLAPGIALAQQCGKDADCELALICDDGVCKSPAPRLFSVTAEERTNLLHQRRELLENSRPSVAWPVLSMMLGTAGEVAVVIAFRSSAVIAVLLGATAGIPLLMGLVFTIVNVVRNGEINKETEVLWREELRLREWLTVQQPPMLELARF